MPDTSQTRAEANAKNALHSTGPTSAEGKARSSRNAIKHGLTSTEIVLPNENPDAFDETLDRWLDHYQPQDPAQEAAIERAVVAKWRLDRCARVETERLAGRVRHAADRYDLGRFTAAEELGRRLIDDPINRRDSPPLREVDFHARIDARLDDDPALLTRRLQATVQGVDWLLARWSELAAILNTHGFWHTPETFRALWLLGKRPQDAMADTIVQELFLAASVAHPDGSRDPEFLNLWNDCYQARLNLTGLTISYVQFETIRKKHPADPATAREQLSEIVRRESCRLAALKENHLDPLDRLDRAAAGRLATFDETKEGTLLRRYESALEKEYHRSVADLLRLRKEPVPEPREPAVEALLQNEPVSETVVETEVASDAPPAPSPATAASDVTTYEHSFTNHFDVRPGVKTAPSAAG